MEVDVHLLPTNLLQAMDHLLCSRISVRIFQETSKSGVQTWSAKLLLTLHHLVVFLGIFSVWRSLCSFFSSGSLGREMGAL